MPQRWPLIFVIALWLSSAAAAQSVLPAVPQAPPPAPTDFDGRVEQILNGSSAEAARSPAAPASGEFVTTDELPALLPLDLEPLPSPAAPSTGSSVEIQVEPEEGLLEDSPTGGHVRWRYFNERGRLRAGNPRERQTEQQWRVLLSAGVSTDWLDLKATYIDASSFGRELPPTMLDVNRSDMLEMYGDLLLLQEGELESRLRYGRQLLDYGSERFVSHYDWANIERNFEGGRWYTTTGSSSFDAFIVQPVNAAAGSPSRPRSFDHADRSALFAGLYGSSDTDALGVWDLFWFFSEESEPQVERLDGSFHTVGARWNWELPMGEGEKPPLTWLWELEGAGQFGRDNFFAGGNGQDITAGALSAVAGSRLRDADLELTLTGFGWVGSGDGNPGDGRQSTWHLLYPDAHRYWGLIDNLSGSNLTDLGLEAKLSWARDVAFDVQWHRFHKTRSKDFVYDAQGQPIPGTAGTPGEIGTELDFNLIFGTPEDSLQVGYFLFWYGDAITAQPALDRPDAGQFYVSFTSRF